MWGFGGRFYWGRKEGGKIEGIVVVFAWMSSQEKHLKNYVQLYSSLGWNSLVCHSQFLNSFFPEKATSLAFDILTELVEELKIRPCPVVFVSFSGGPKACMYNVLQIIEGKCGAQCSLDNYQLVKDCISGYIYDSSPVDFTSDLGTKFILHPTILKVSHPPRFALWIANSIASCLDALFLNSFESQRAEYWQTLYSSARMGAPYLILCSENDDLASYKTICTFAQRLQDLGANVKVVKWNDSPHVGHYRIYPIDYKAAVTELLGKASVIYLRRIKQLGGDRMHFNGMQDKISNSMCNPRKSMERSSHSFQGLAVEPRDQFLLPDSMNYLEGRDVESLQDEQKEGLIHFPSTPSINAHGVLGQILFDVCVPKNVEGWEMRRSESSDNLNGPPFISSQRQSPFNPIKCIRSRL
ncbi:uncharacterized protein LOC131161715 [Malania oleifera]|uniref:uncharacterized protein LOC131161715 n=1 Tax=Malania oleifera TaxID=397392 RepID=UPI0025AE94EE|nr:uncharacterized protein LOC131161715 [Malania oleifera]